MDSPPAARRDRLVEEACVKQMYNAAPPPLSSSLTPPTFTSLHGSSNLHSSEALKGPKLCRMGMQKCGGILHGLPKRISVSYKQIRFSTCAVGRCEISALAHEVVDDAVEGRALEVQGLAHTADALLACSERWKNWFRGQLSNLGDAV